MELLMTIIAGMLLGIGALGTIYPVLPGSLTSLAALILWGVVLNSPSTWMTAGIGIALVIVGMTASYVLSGRTLRRQRVPKGPIMYGVLGAVIGFFVLPIVGLFLGFAVGLFAGQMRELRDVAEAARSSWLVLKAMGTGILIEFVCACLASLTFAIGAFSHFFSHFWA